MTPTLRLSPKVQFVPYAPGLRQSALRISLTVQDVAAPSPAELAVSLTELIDTHLQPPKEPLVPSNPSEPLSHQFSSVIAGCFVRLMRGGGLAVFGAALVEDVQRLEASVVLPCPEESHPAATAVLAWILQTANLCLAGQAVLERGPSLGLLLKKVSTQAPPGINTIRFLEAAYEQGIPCQRISGTTYQYGWGARSRWFDSSFTDVTPTIASNLARDKFATAKLLAHAGLPVPKHRFAASEEQALEIAKDLGYPVVVKPSDKDGGVGVSAGLRNDQQVVNAYLAARSVSKKILVEKHFEGKDYRLQVLNGKVFWAVHRIPGGVVGDGASSVLALLACLNAEPARGAKGTNALLKQIDLDDEALDLLSQQGLSTGSTPATGQFVKLRRAANVASGGRPVPVLDIAHPDNLDLAERAARLLRLDLAGIDLLIPDITQSWVSSGAAICEVNAQPQLSPHLPGLILQSLVKNQGRIPVIVVAGSPASRVASQSLLEILRKSGLYVGLASHPLSFVGQPSNALGISRAVPAAQALLLDPKVQAVVICLEAADLMKPGFPFDQYSTLVLLGDPAAHPDKAALTRGAQQLTAQCSGTVYCEKAPAVWGLAAGPRVQQATPQTTLASITVAVSDFWKDKPQTPST